MPTELKEKYPFSVDSWTVLAKRKRYHFLTHAHSDHTSGIEAFANRPIYCSDTTRRLVLRRFPALATFRFITLEIGEAKLIADDEEPFTVTSLDANHCPGALMLLFEGSFGNVLHTGDCRLTADCLANVLDRYKAQQRVLDCLFLDCTFGKERLKMPSKKEAFHQVQQVILNNPQAPIIYLACDLLGSEELLAELVEYFRTKLFIDRNALPEYFADMMIVAPELVTEDPQSTRFHVCEGYPRLYDRAKIKFMNAHRLRQPEPLFIRPSAQWYTFEERLGGAGCGMILDVALKRPGARNRPLPVPKAAERDQHGVWHVCYSIHSSRSELERAIEILWPKEVISTTPSCHASELSGRAGQHRADIASFITNKVRKEPEEKCVSWLGSPKRTLKTGFVSKSPTISRASKKGRVGELLLQDCEHDGLTSVVPLFGMARHTVPPSPPLSFASTDSQPDQDVLLDTPSTVEYFSDCGQDSPRKLDDWFLRDDFDNVGVLLKNSTPSSPPSLSLQNEEGMLKLSSQAAERKDEELEDVADKENANASILVSPNVTMSTIKNNTQRGVAILKETTRKLYRSLRAPIPSPLPSLLDLYNWPY